MELSNMNQKKDKKRFENQVTGLIRRGMSPIFAYRMIEAQHRKKHLCRMYANYSHYCRATRIKIKI